LRAAVFQQPVRCVEGDVCVVAFELKVFRRSAISSKTLQRGCSFFVGQLIIYRLDFAPNVISSSEAGFLDELCADMKQVLSGVVGLIHMLLVGMIF